MKRWLAIALLAACGPTNGTSLDALPARTAVVGQELAVMLHARRTAAGLTFSSDLGDLATRNQRPTLTAYDGGLAVFRWIPLGSDVGDHHIDFSANIDGVGTTTRLDVTVVAGAAGLTFREPAGDGTSIDPARVPCAEVAILVDDTAASQVQLARGSVWTDGGELQQDGPLSGTLKFCPTKDQLMAGSIWQFSLVADDHAGGKAEKRYAVVLSSLPTRPTPPPAPDPGPSPPVPACDPNPPAITHKPHPNITTTGNLHLHDEVTDSYGVYDSTVYWSTTAPADAANPDLSLMQWLPMTFTGGGATDSTFAATIDNPNVGAPSGTTTTIYYVIVATDSDDAVAGCSYHTTQTSLYSFSVKQP